MQDYELDAYLGDDITITDDQRAALHRASDMIDTRYPNADLRDDAETAFAAAMQVILGDTTVDDEATAWSDARRAERTAMASLTGAIIAASADESENAIAQRTGIHRGTVRKALGK